MIMKDVEIQKGYIPGAIGRVVELHGTYYARQWGFGLFFEALVATGLANFLSRYDESHDGFGSRLMVNGLWDQSLLMEVRLLRMVLICAGSFLILNIWVRVSGIN
jgi:hypothetical protein